MNKYNDVLKLIDKNKEKYPNISKIWSQFILNQYESLQESLTYCEEIFENIKDKVDEDMDEKNNFITIPVKT
jgi:hypothetical protein